MGPAGAVRLREQSLRHGHGAGALGIGNRHPAQGRVLPDRLRGGRRHGRRRGRGRGPPRGPCRPRERQALFPRMPDLPLPRAFDVRRPALSRQGRGRGLDARGPDRALPGMAGGQPHDPCRTMSTAIEAEIAAEIAEAVAFAEAGTWEPVEDLTRYTYADVPRQPAARHEARADQSRNGRDDLPRGRERGDPRGAASATSASS